MRDQLLIHCSTIGRHFAGTKSLENVHVGVTGVTCSSSFFFLSNSTCLQSSTRVMLQQIYKAQLKKVVGPQQNKSPRFGQCLPVREESKDFG